MNLSQVVIEKNGTMLTISRVDNYISRIFTCSNADEIVAQSKLNMMIITS